MNRRLALFLATLGAAAFAWFLLRNEEGAGPDRQPADGTPEEQPRRCAGITRGGSRCSREAEPGSEFCWQHG